MATELGKNLRRLLERHHLSPSQLSQRSGVDKPRISRMLSGKTTNPQVDTIRPIAECLRVTIDQLVGDSPLPMDETHGIVMQVNRMVVPVIEWKNLSYWMDIKDQFLPRKTIDARSNVSSYAFAVEVIDDRFEPKFSQSSMLIVDPNATPRHRDYIVQAGETKESFCIQQVLYESGKVMGKLVGEPATLQSLSREIEHLGVIVEAHFNQR